MSQQLAVWLFEACVGVLSLEQGQLRFAYLPSWLENPQAVPLSQGLPLQNEPFGDQAARSFFAGLLPEGGMRQLLARQLQLSGGNDFGLLQRLGGDCAGAVRLLEPDGAAGAHQPPRVAWLGPESLRAVLADLPTSPMLVARGELRLSLAGAQSKLPVVVLPGPADSGPVDPGEGLIEPVGGEGLRIGLPLAGTPSTHILKPEIAAFGGSVLNEAFCLHLAAAMGLPVAQAQILPVGSQSVLLVHRYDRTGLPGPGAGSAALAQLRRLHQEDFAQALGVGPELKYQNEGGPDLMACFDLLRRVCRPSGLAVLRLLDAVIFNALVGNHDAHAKNFSLLYRGPQPELAPLYDLLCTAAYPQLSDKMAMKIGSRYRFSQLMPRHWQQLAQSAGLSWPQVRLRLQRVSERLPRVAERLQAQAPFSGAPIVQQITSLIGQRCALTQRRLAEPPP